MAANLDREVLTRGGRIEVEGAAEDFDPLQYLMALLARKFEPFADEIALKSAFDFMQFTRRAHEKTD
eukprot:2483625-Lingulodinium_polyedra.AAC.1